MSFQQLPPVLDPRFARRRIVRDVSLAQNLDSLRAKVCDLRHDIVESEQGVEVLGVTIGGDPEADLAVTRPVRNDHSLGLGNELGSRDLWGKVRSAEDDRSLHVMDTGREAARLRNEDRRELIELPARVARAP